MKVDLYCICGAGAEGEIEPPAAAEKFRTFWFQVHTGPEHRECSRKEASAALAAKDKAGLGMDP